MVGVWIFSGNTQCADLLYLKVMILAEIVEEISGPGILLQMFV